MSWFKKLLGARASHGQQHLTELGTSFVYVRMPGDAQPTERHYLFEDPIEEQLKIRNLGYISGGGSLQSAPDENGVRRIELTGIDIEAEDLDPVRALLRNLLPDLGAPVGTQIEFTLEDQRFQDRLTDSGWIEREPRTDRHPGFDL